MRERERGSGRGGFLAALALVGAGIFILSRIVPVRIDGYQFRELLRDEVRHAAVNGPTSDGATRTRIMDAAVAMRIPIDNKDLRIERSQVRVVISASYEKPIDLKLGTYVYRFRAKEEAPLF